MIIIIITPCSASKNDSFPIPPGSKVVQPSYYLDDEDLLSKLKNIRNNVFKDPRACLGIKQTYAFDLYTLAGNVYKTIRESGKLRIIRSMLISSANIEWFFLSGGYGIIHALEVGNKYQATFSQSIAYQKGIPYTANLWRDSLILICEAIFSKFQPDWVYVFGSRDYTFFIKKTRFWMNKNNIKIFESTGSSGPCWLAPKLSELTEAILNAGLNEFNDKYERFIKQE